MHGGEQWKARLEEQEGAAGELLGVKELRLPREGEEMGLTLSPLPQLKPGVPLPSPEDLRGKILIKNKKNQFSGPAAPSEEPVGGAEGGCPATAPQDQDTGVSPAWERAGWGAGGKGERGWACGGCAGEPAWCVVWAGRAGWPWC